MKKLFVYILITVFVMTSSVISWGTASAESISDLKDKIDQFDKEQSEINDKKGSIENDKKDIESKIDENITKQNTVKSDIATIDEKLTSTKAAIQTKENEIIETNNEMDKLKSEIEALKIEIKDLQERIKKREALLKDRLRAMQKNGGAMKYIEVILGSKSFGDFISRSSAVTTIMDQDKSIMEIHEADKKALEDKKVVVETKKDEVEQKKLALENQKQELVSLKAQLDNQMAEKATLMAKLEKEHEHLEEYKLSLAEEQAILNAQAAAIQKAKQIAEQEKGKLEQLAREQAAREKAEREKAAREKAAQQPGNSSVGTNPTGGSGNGDFIWPAPGRISSGFGPRIHPISGIVGKQHNGIDIANASGTAIKAAATGVVSTASYGYNGGYGNFIIITHFINGKTYATLYAHLNSLSVSVGQVVSQGQVIAAMGSTGDSTGPHLHFEVHPGGYKNPVNPLGYLP